MVAHLCPVKFQRLLSYIWPVPVERITGAFGPLEARYEEGRLVLNSAQGNQSFGSLHRVWKAVFTGLGVQGAPPGEVLLLGLGAGSVPSILRGEWGLSCPITAVEIDPAMISVAERHFGLRSWSALTVIEGDAILQAHALKQRFDLVVVDLFNDLDLARGADTLGFAHALRDRCSGTLCFNTVDYDAPSGARCDKVLANLKRVFGSVDELRLEGVNRVFIAR
jgi:spermidine synthase